MSAGSIEIIDLVARWVHLIAGIMWIGNSFLWNWMDRNLEPPGAGARAMTPEPTGSIWLLHSGAFYYAEKTLLAGAPMPARLHWFRWQAYTTWWTGLVLLIAVYWLGGRAALTDPAVADLSQGAAVAVGAGGIVLGWMIYEAAHRVLAPRSAALAAAFWLTGLAAISFAFTELLSGRAALMHVGAMIGTLMAGNVVFTIMPAQRELVASVGAPPGADIAGSAASARAKRVSIDNNYFVFPVIALMMTSHFSALYGQPRAWIPLAIILAGGALTRHLLNIRFSFAAWKPALTGAIALTVGALYASVVFSRSAPTATPLATGPVEFADVRHVIDRRCSSCHASEPSDLTFGVAPGGVRFDTPEQIVALAARIQQRAVVDQTMPSANKTRMTAAERDLLRRWIAEGAQLPGAQLPR